MTKKPKKSILATDVIPTASRALYDAICKLTPTGDDGFEGLVRDAWHEAGGDRLRLQKSGHQGGVDAIGDADQPVIVGIEDKRYKQTTSLRLDDLKAKLLEAATGGSPVDLWILAASKEISGSDVNALKALGGDYGIGVVVLDWWNHEDPTSNLPSLLTLAPNAVRKRLGVDGESYLKTISKHPQLEKAQGIIAQLIKQPDLAFSHTVDETKRLFLKTLQSAEDSKARFGFIASIDLDDTDHVSRNKIVDQIEGLTENTVQAPMCVLLGDEGAGKSWVALEWCKKQFSGDAPTLVLWMSARNVNEGKLENALGSALSNWVEKPRQTHDFWTRRILQWKRVYGDQENQPFIWLVLDGLNEGQSQEQVSQLLIETTSSEWRGKIGVVATDRKSHWGTIFVDGASLPHPPQKIGVGKFEDSELAELLAKYGKTPDDFSSEVLNIIKWPSWFAVAATMFTQESEWSLHSYEQLMARYWQHYLKSRGQIGSVGEKDFQSFTSKLGRDLQNKLTEETKLTLTAIRDELFEGKLAEDNRIFTNVMQIVDGLWVREVADTNEYLITPEVLPFLAGLALFNELKDIQTEDEYGSILENFLGPIEERDAGADILAAVAAIVFLEPAMWEAVWVRPLMVRWIQNHNFKPRHFQMLWRFGRSCPHLVIDVAETLWLARSTGHWVDEALIKALANLAEAPEAEQAVWQALEKWTGLYWDDVKAGQFIGYKSDPAKKAEVEAEALQRVEALKQELSLESLDTLGLTHQDNPEGCSWMIRRAFAVLSYLPRSKAGDVIKNWAFSRVVMGQPLHFDDLAWLLRSNQIDAEETAPILFSVFDDLWASKSERVRKGGAWLLEAYGSPKAENKLQALGKELTSYRKTNSELAYNVVGGVAQHLPDYNGNATAKAIVLGELAINPTIDISPQASAILQEVASELSPPLQNDGGWLDSTFKKVLPAIARWDKPNFVRLLTDTQQQIANLSDNELISSSFGCPYLSDTQIDTVTKQLTAALVHLKGGKLKGERLTMLYDLLSISLLNKTAQEQFSIWKELPEVADVPVSTYLPIGIVDSDLFKQICAELAEQSRPQQILHLLEFLNQAQQVDIGDGHEIFGELFRHEEEIVRNKCIDVGLSNDSQILSKTLLETGWSARDDLDVKERMRGSLLLCLAATKDTFEDISKRIDPGAQSFLWKQLSYSKSLNGPFKHFVEAAINQELTPPKSRAIHSLQMNHQEALQHLYDQERPWLEPKIIEMLTGTKPWFPLFEAWPQLNCIELLFAHGHALAIEKWQAWNENRTTGTYVRHHKFESLPFQFDTAEDHYCLREELIDQARNDEDLMDLGAIAVQAKQVPWVVEFIKSTLETTDDPGKLARVITLAGFLDHSDEVRALWEGPLSKAPAKGWLGIVYKAAKRHAEDAFHANHWLISLIAAKTDEDFLRYWCLMEAAMPPRMLSQFAKRLRDTSEQRSEQKNLFIAINWQAARARDKSAVRQLGNTLFSHKTGFSHAIPWAL